MNNKPNNKERNKIFMLRWYDIWEVIIADIQRDKITTWLRKNVITFIRRFITKHTSRQFFVPAVEYSIIGFHLNDAKAEVFTSEIIRLCCTSR